LGFRSRSVWASGIAGVGLGASFCVLIRCCLPQEGQMAFVLNALLCCNVGGIYFGTAIAGNCRTTLIIDFVVLGLYAIGCLASLYHSPYWLVALWFAHGCYDMLHDHRIVERKRQEEIGMARIHRANCGYPIWCIGVDWTIALYTLLVQAPQWKPIG